MTNTVVNLSPKVPVIARNVAERNDEAIPLVEPQTTGLLCSFQSLPPFRRAGAMTEKIKTPLKKF